MSTLQCNDEANSNSTALTLENTSISEFSLSESPLLTLTLQINALHWPHCVILRQGEDILHLCCLEAKKTVLVRRSGCGVSTPANGLTTSGGSFFKIKHTRKCARFPAYLMHGSTCIYKQQLPL